MKLEVVSVSDLYFGGRGEALEIRLTKIDQQILDYDAPTVLNAGAKPRAKSLY